jgi:heat shock protein HtpX
MASPNLYTQADSNVYKTWFLLISFLVFVIFLGWFFSYILDNNIFLIVAILLSISQSIAGYWYSDKIVFESQPNAFATGRDAKHAVVAVTRGLLEKLDRSELEGVLAHELAHIGNKDMLLGTVVVVLVGVISLLSRMFLRSGALSRRNSKNSRNTSGLLGILGIVGAILSPIVALFIQLAISRKREFLADATGALLTRYPEGLASALEKISQDNTPIRKTDRSIAHLYISNPFKGKSFITKLFSTHPPAEERIRILRGMEIK